MSKLRNIGMSLLLSTQLVNGNPNVNQIPKNSSEGKKIEKALSHTIQNDVIKNTTIALCESLEKTDSIAYILTPGSKVYKDSEGKQVLLISPKGIVIRNSAINQKKSTQDFLCVEYRGHKAWINTTSLTESDFKSLEEIEKPTTEKVIKVNKGKRRMEIYDQYGKHKVKEFKIAICSGDEGDKKIEGDGNTPEGKYYICFKNPASSFGTNPRTGGKLGSLQISYPNSQDAFEGLIAGDITERQFNSINTSIETKGIPSQGTRLGNYIMIHGGGSDYDWTIGCMALADEDMLRLYNFILTRTELYIE